MKIENTRDPSNKPPIVLLLYGEGGVGKTTFVSTAPKPFLADCERGAKYFGLRGISLDFGNVQSWSDMQDVLTLAESGDYDTIAIDPIGELMDKLKKFMVAKGDSKLVQKDGSPTMAGWGWLKKTFRDLLKAMQQSGKHIILVAHVDEKSDEDRIVKRPKIETKMSEEIVSMVDVVGYMTVVTDPEEGEKRIIRVDAGSDKFVAKDRTGQLGKVIPPDFAKIVKACQGTEMFNWSNEGAVNTTKNPEKEAVKNGLNDKLKKANTKNDNK